MECVLLPFSVSFPVINAALQHLCKDKEMNCCKKKKKIFGGSMDFLRLYTVEGDPQASLTFCQSRKCFSSQNERIEDLWAQWHEVQILPTSPARWLSPKGTYNCVWKVTLLCYGNFRFWNEISCLGLCKYNLCSKKTSFEIETSVRQKNIKAQSQTCQLTFTRLFLFHFVWVLCWSQNKWWKGTTKLKIMYFSEHHHSC